MYEEQFGTVGIEYYIDKINPLVKDKCLELYNNKRDLFENMKGSKRNHQPWAGGYGDHILEVMTLGYRLYYNLSSARPIPFLLEDVMFVLFVHDLEKLYPDQVDNLQQNTGMEPKLAKKRVRESLFEQFGFTEYIERNSHIRIALDTVEGENANYSPHRRVMNELGALCHCADILSARLWYDYPKISSTPTTPTIDPNAPTPEALNAVQPKLGVAMAPNGDPILMEYKDKGAGMEFGGG